MGAAATRANDLTKAEFWLREMRVAYPDDLRWGPALIGVLQSKGKLADARKLAEEIRGAHWQDPLYFYQLGRLQAGMRQPREAIESFQKVLQLSNAAVLQSMTHMQLGELHASLDELDDAITEYRTAKQLSGYALVPLALLLGEKGLYAEEVAEYRAVLRDSPNNATALNNLAYTFAERGENLDEALAMARRAVEALPGNSNMVDTLGWVYFRKGMFADAEATMVDALQSEGGTHPTLREHLGAVMDARGQWTDARRELRTLMDGELRPNQLIRMKELLRELQTR